MTLSRVQKIVAINRKATPLSITILTPNSSDPARAQELGNDNASNAKYNMIINKK